jgi:ribosome-associated heat shock protein Hsp15
MTTAPGTVRLDVWLDVACLFRTRSEAQRACKVGRVTVNGLAAKPHRDLRVGDELAISRPPGRQQVVVVRALADKHMPRVEARKLYEDRTRPPTPAEVEMQRMERLYRASTGPTPRLNRRHQRDVAKRKLRS